MRKSLWLRMAAVGFLAMAAGSAQSITIKPVPTYCVDCRPCMTNRDCGIDPVNGIEAGVCWPYPHYPCSSGGTCSCR